MDYFILVCVSAIKGYFKIKIQSVFLQNLSFMLDTPKKNNFQDL